MLRKVPIIGIISIHALLAESDPQAIYPCVTPPKFLSTLSLRRATNVRGHGDNGSRNFYPRSPCGERLVNGDVRSSFFGNFYPRSPCGERLASSTVIVILRNFYPRSPCGERPPYNLIIHHAKKISIHALLAESDCSPGFGFC